jgi:methylase of polypeptide subunit release factors
LRPGGVLALEIGETQGGDALALVRGAATDAGGAAYDDAALHRDYAGKDRVIVARRGD